MVAPYRGEELSLQELFSAFSHKLKEVLADPNKYVAQMTLGGLVVDRLQVL